MYRGFTVASSGPSAPHAVVRRFHASSSFFLLEKRASWQACGVNKPMSVPVRKDKYKPQQTPFLPYKYPEQSPQTPLSSQPSSFTPFFTTFPNNYRPIYQPHSIPHLPCRSTNPSNMNFWFLLPLLVALNVCMSSNNYVKMVSKILTKFEQAQGGNGGSGVSVGVQPTMYNVFQNTDQDRTALF